MGLKERVYSVLIVSASKNLNEALQSQLPESRYDPVKLVSNVSMAKRLLMERSFDYVIVNSPLPDDTGVRFAIDTSRSREAVVLLLIRSELHEEVFERVVEYGVFTLPKPTSKPMLSLALGWMSGARERMRESEKKTQSIEEKIGEIRLVNRAKWLLINNLHMSEPEAHRYIEKQAMNRCVAKRIVAQEIVDRYADEHSLS